MKLGIYGLNEGAVHVPDATRRLARLAEELGYESWWVGEHAVLPDPRVDPSPMEPDQPILDPLVHLAFVAAVTTRLALGVGIVILPQRNPVVLAKEVATLDVLSGGRLHLGIGAGYLAPEMEAVGVSMAERGARTDEHLAAMRALWAEPVQPFTGRYHSFAGVDAFPKPVHTGGVRVVVGGHSRAALARAHRHGHGWYGAGIEPAEAAVLLDELRAVGADVERDPELGPLEISVTPPLGPVDDDTWTAYAALGIDRLILYPEEDCLRETARAEQFLRDHARLARTTGGAPTS